MSKVAMFMAKPITWGGYLKFCVVCVALSLSELGAMWFITNYRWHKMFDD